MLSPARLSVARIGDRSGKSAQALWDSLPPPCIALSQTKTAQPASQANSEPTVDPKTAAQATAEAEITAQLSVEAETAPELTEKKDTTLKLAAKRKPSSKTSARSHS
jgi:hypothetical protein